MSLPSPKKTALLFFSGSELCLHNPTATALLATAKKLRSQVIAADGGANLALKYGLIPSVIIGDCDSILPQNKKLLEQKNIPFLTYPQQKEKTDSELALEYAANEGCTRVICFGVEGDRSDHFLANIFLLSTYAQKGITVQVIGEKCWYFFSTGKLEVRGKVGDLFTLLALTPSVQDVKTSGLAYSLDSDPLILGTSLGVSNVFSEDKVSVTHQQGVILAIHTPQ